MTEIAVIVFAVLFGFYLKGLSGMGEAIPLATVGVLFIPVSDLVVIITMLDLLGSAAAMRSSRLDLVRVEDRPYIVFLLLGIAIGVSVLVWAPTDVLTAVFLVSLVVVGAFMTRTALIRGPIPSRSGLDAFVPVERAATSLYAGFSGGVTGIDGPPLAFSLFRTRGLVDIRHQLMRLILISAAARATLLVVSGVVTWRLLMTGLALIPFAVGAFYLSRRIHTTVNPRIIAGLCGALCISSVLAAVMR